MIAYPHYCSVVRPTISKKCKIFNLTGPTWVYENRGERDKRYVTISFVSRISNNWTRFIALEIIFWNALKSKYLNSYKNVWFPNWQWRRLIQLPPMYKHKDFYLWKLNASLQSHFSYILSDSLINTLSERRLYCRNKYKFI